MSEKKTLRSRLWFNNPDDREMTALYLERYLNYGLTREELQGDKPIIAIAQTGSDLSPCNRHHIELSKRVRDGVIAAGGTVIEIPVHPFRKQANVPQAMLDRNLAYLSLVETLYGYPIDGVVLNIGCDKTTPALLMAGGIGQYSSDCIVRWSDVERMVPWSTHRIRHNRLEGARIACQGRN
jgi:dihydroxy-acid dehydratase